MKAKTFIATLLLAMYFFSLTSFAENESSRNGIYDYSWKGIANSKFISNQLILGLINLTEQIENSKQLRFGDVVRLNIDSPGGFLLSADNLTEYFRSFENAVFAKTGNNLIVRVKNKCESACVVVAAKIYSNTINSALSHTDFKVCKSAKFGFHAPFSVINGKQVTNDYLFLLYRNAGIYEDWIKAHIDAFDTTKMTYYSAMQLSHDYDPRDLNPDAKQIGFIWRENSSGGVANIVDDPDCPENQF